ncbi:MAG: 50S ribosomal protein L19 [Planctomycetes bacterium]|nr:50S ribosomal protein L19 [Planctomycetota bacterium]
MRHALIEIVEKAHMKDSPPEFHVGDTVDVLTRIIEGDRERTQIFNGVVIGRRGQGINETFTVRRIVNNEGVERIFMVHSPRIVDVAVKRRGKTRRAKLYYLRDRVGKGRKLKELRVSKGKKSGAKTGETPKGAAGADKSDDAKKPEVVGV